MLGYDALRKLFRPKKDDLSVTFRISHNEELRALCRMHNIIGILKFRRLQWTWYVP